MATYFGANLPFVGGAQGTMSRQEDVQLVHNDLLQLLFTVPGERIHRPDLGTLLWTTVFEQFDDYSVSQLRESVERAIAEYEPRLTRVNVQLTPIKATRQLTVQVTGDVLLGNKSVPLSLEKTLSLGSPSLGG